MDVSCKRWHSRAQTKLVPGRVESALVRFWTQCEGSKHCNKWILILTIPLRLNAILRNLKVKLFLEKRCKCFSFYNQCTRCSSKMSWLQWKVSKTPNRAYLRSCSFPNLSHSETLLPTNGGTWWNVWCNMWLNITPWCIIHRHRFQNPNTSRENHPLWALHWAAFYIFVIIIVQGCLRGSRDVSYKLLIIEVHIDQKWPEMARTCQPRHIVVGEFVRAVIHDPSAHFVIRHYFLPRWGPRKGAARIERFNKCVCWDFHEGELFIYECKDGNVQNLWKVSGSAFSEAF